MIATRVLPGNEGRRSPGHELHDAPGYPRPCSRGGSRGPEYWRRGKRLVGDHDAWQRTAASIR